MSEPVPTKRWSHIAVNSLYVLAAVALTNGLWRRLPDGRLAIGGTDQYLFEWFLWHGPHSILNGHSPFFTTLWNPPHGANLMANTSALGLGLPLAPVTMLFGPQVTLVLLLTIGMAASAAAWYWLYRKFVPGPILGPAIAGAFCGFAPAMVSHANGAHLNLVITALVPFIVYHALALREPGRAWRNGTALGLLIVYQIFIGEELVLLTALGLGLYCLLYAAFAPSRARAALVPMAKGLGVALAVALPPLAYPLWWQFTGPQHYSGVASAASTVNDIMSMVILPSQSFIGDQASTKQYVQFHNEENAFFGLPLLVVAGFGAFKLRRELAVRLSVIMIIVSAILSLGGEVHFGGHELGWGPWALIGELPLFDAVIVSRMTLLAIPFFGLLLATMTARLLASGADLPRAQALRVHRYGLLAIAIAMVSLAPTPLPVHDRPAIPAFITSGTWKQNIPPGSTVMTVPMTMADGGIDTINWQVPADGQFALVGGYFVGPHGTDDLTGYHFPATTATQRLINDVWRTGKTPTVADKQRSQARADLAALGVDAIVVALRGHVAETLATLTQLLGVEPVRVSDVWLWRVRDGSAVRTVS